MKMFCKWLGHKYIKKELRATGNGDMWQGYTYIIRTCGRCNIEYLRIGVVDYSDHGNTHAVKERFQINGKTISETGYTKISEKEFGKHNEDYHSPDVNFDFAGEKQKRKSG